MTIVTGATGAGVTTWSRALSALLGTPFAALGPSAPLPMPAGGDIAADLAHVTGIPASALDDAFSLGFARVAQVAWLVTEPGPDRIIDAGDWASLATAVTAVEQFAGHLRQARPSHGGQSQDKAAFLRIQEVGRHLERIADGLWGLPVTFVTTPDPAGVAAVRHAASAATLIGLQLQQITVNRVLPDLPPSEWGSTRAAQQDHALGQLAAVADAVGAGLTVVAESGCSPTDPIQHEQLARSAQRRDPPVTRLRPGPQVPAGAGVATVRAPRGCSATRVGEDFELVVPVGTEPGVTASRRGDDLLVTAGGVCRVLRLAGALARCAVTGGRHDGCNLILTLTPDPRLWRRNVSARDPRRD